MQYKRTQTFPGGYHTCRYGHDPLGAVVRRTSHGSQATFMHYYISPPLSRLRSEKLKHRNQSGLAVSASNCLVSFNITGCILRQSLTTIANTMQTVCHLKRVRPFSVRSEACNQSSFFDLTTARSQDFKSSKPAERRHCRVEGQSTRVAAAAALLDFHSARQCRWAGNGMVSGQDGPSTTTVCCLTIHTLSPICPRDDLYPSGWRVQRR